MELRTDSIGAAPLPAQNIELQQRSAAVKPDPASRPVPAIPDPVSIPVSAGNIVSVGRTTGNAANQGSYTNEMTANFQNGEQYFTSGEYEKALQSYKSAEKLARAHLGDVDACLVLSKIYERYGNQKLSITFAKEALEIEERNNVVIRMDSFPQQPESRAALYSLGDAYIKGGLPDKALEVLSGYSAKDDAKKMNKDNIGLFLMHARALYSAGSEDPANYQRGLEEIKIIEKSMPGVFGRDGFSAERMNADADMLGTYQYMGMHDDAIKLGEKFISKVPNFPGVTQALAASYLSKLDYDKAIDILVGQNGIANADFSKLDASSVLSLLGACISKIGLGQDPDNKMRVILPKLMERISTILSSGEKHFPYSSEMIALKQAEYLQSLSYGRSSELSEIAASKMPGGGEVSNTFVRQSINDRIMDSVISNSSFSIDGKSVELQKLDEYVPDATSGDAIGLGPEMRMLASNRYGNPYFLRDANMERLKSDISEKRADYRTISAKEAIMLASELTMDKLKYSDEDPSVDLPHIPLEDKIEVGKGVCRHYAPIFKAYFEAIKSENPNLSNMTAFNLNSNNHAWNMVLDVRPDRIIALNIDPTFDDSDNIFGNRLDGYDTDHFDPLSDDPEILQRNIANNPGKEWIPDAIIKLATIRLGQKNYEEVFRLVDGFFEKYEGNSRAAFFCFIGLRAALSAAINNQVPFDKVVEYEGKLMSLDPSEQKKEAVKSAASLYSQLAVELSVSDPESAIVFNKKAADVLSVFDK